MSKRNPKDVICIMGPTGVGKTAVAMRLAQSPQLAGQVDVISVDSAMVYRGMDIGTAKPTLAEQAEVPHQLIDLCNPDEHYSVGRFCADASKAIEASLQAGRIPLLVGGTMMYFDRLQRGMIALPAIPEGVTASVKSMLVDLGVAGLYRELSLVDLPWAQKIHPNDTQRIMRGMAVHMATGKPLSAWQAERTHLPCDHNWCNVGIFPTDRSQLHQQLARRFAAMLEQGLLSEMQALMARYDLRPEMPSMRAVGYRQLWSYVTGATEYDTMVERALASTRQLAKRQQTWLRSWPNLLNYGGDIAAVCDKILGLLQR